MRTKTPKIEREKPYVPPDLPNPEAPAEDIKRLSFAVDSEGRIVWDGMRSATRDKLKAVLSDPQTARNLGVEQPAIATVEVFDPAWTGALYDSIGKVEAFFAGKIYHIPPDIAEQAFTFSEAEKEKLAGPTAKVINKYASTWMVTFKDEIALAFLFVTITAVKLQMADMLTKMRTPIRAIPPRQEPSAADLDAVALEKSVGDGKPDA